MPRPRSWRPSPPVVSPWVRAMRASGIAESTIEGRERALRRWCTYTGDRPFEATWREVEGFIAGELGHTTPATRRNTVSHLHRFYVWARRQGLTDHDPTELVDRARAPAGLPRPIHDTDLALALMMSAGHMSAALVLMATSGLRCVELVRLRWVDVTEHALRLRGKGDKERVVPLHAAGRAALDELDRPDQWVLPWRETLPANPGQTASRAINRFLRSIGVDATAHQVRHWCGTKALAATGDLRAVQTLLGHASPTTTAIYTALDPSRIAQAVHGIQLPAGEAPAPPIRVPLPELK